MFGEYLRNLREEKGYSLRDFSKEIGIVASYLSDIERDCRNAPAYELLDKISEKLNLDESQRDKLFALAINDKCNLPPTIVYKLKNYPELLNIIRNYVR